MSVQRLSSGFDRLNKPVSVAPWVRPAEWLPLPSVASTEEKVVGLHAVFADSNYAALSCAGAYTVNWGDGVTENFATGVTAYHQYSYSAPGLAGTEYTDENGLTYKQAVVTITPQAGSILTSVDFRPRHTAHPVLNSPSGWLELLVSSPYLSSLFVGSNLSTHSTHVFLKQFQLISDNSVTDFSSLLYNCYTLVSIPVLKSSAGVNFSWMFGLCFGLHNLPMMDTSAGTNFSYMFYYCSSLAGIPPINTGAGTNFNSMFSSCFALKAIPPLNTASGLVFSNMFAECYGLTTVPLMNTSLGTDFSNMFNGCMGLVSVPAFNVTSASLGLTNMLSACTALASAVINNVKISISYSNCRLSAGALNDIYTNLPAVTSKIITVTGNPGVTSDTPSIATAKGWTVTG